MLSFLAAAESYQLPAASHARGCAIGVDCRRGAINWLGSMGFLDGAKDVFAGDKPVVAADRVTPFDRWLGLDKDLMESEAPKTAVFIDPTDAANYFSVELAKPMGIAFVDNDGECGGVYVDEVLDSGSAAAPGGAAAEGRPAFSSGRRRRRREGQGRRRRPRDDRRLAGGEDEARLLPRADDLPLRPDAAGRRVVRLRGARLNLVRIFQSRARRLLVQDQAEALGDREETVIRKRSPRGGGRRSASQRNLVRIFQLRPASPGPFRGPYRFRIR